MRTGMKTGEKDEKGWLYGVLCVMTVVIASVPLTCNYIMAGGRVTEWTVRVNELAAGFSSGKIYLFPRMEMFTETGNLSGGVNSNFWLLLSGIFMWMTGSIVAVYRCYMLFIQIGTTLASMLFFRKVFAKEKGRMPVFFGTLLYMTCPYRIFVCYDQADLLQAAAFMILPLYAWAVLGVFSEKGKWREVLLMGVVLAGTGYANTVFFVTLFGITLLFCIFTGNFRGISGLIIGGILGFPGLYRLSIYILGRGLPELDAVLRSIMPNGYHIGQYFSSYYWRDDHPGMGLGMLFCLLAVLWIRFVKAEPAGRTCRVFTGISVFFIALSLSQFPWDLVQRLGNWALRLVSLIGTPAVFWGMACFGLCVPAAWGMHKLKTTDNETAAFLIPLIVLCACVWVCIYQCNMLTYTRAPMIFG